MTVTLNLPDDVAAALGRMPETERNAFATALLTPALRWQKASAEGEPYTELRESYATAIASESAIARLWDTPEEDAAWAHL